MPCDAPEASAATDSFVGVAPRGGGVGSVSPTDGGTQASRARAPRWRHTRPGTRGRPPHAHACGRPRSACEYSSIFECRVALAVAEPLGSRITCRIMSRADRKRACIDPSPSAIIVLFLYTGERTAHTRHPRTVRREQPTSRHPQPRDATLSFSSVSSGGAEARATRHSHTRQDPNLVSR